jgi:hypothetical protein
MFRLNFRRLRAKSIEITFVRLTPLKKLSIFIMKKIKLFNKWLGGKSLRSIDLLLV